MGRKTQEPTTATNGLSDMTSRYAIDRNNMNALVAELNSPNFFDNITKLFSDPVDNIISLYVFPFDVKELSPVWKLISDGSILINIYQTSTAVACFLNPLTTPMLDIGSVYVAPAYNSFLDFQPYTKIELYLPYIGFVTLDNDIVIGRTIKIQYAVDLCTGKCTAYLSTTIDGAETVIMTQEGQIGKQIPIAGGVGSDIARSMVNFGIRAGTSVAQMGIGAISSGIAGSTPKSTTEALTTGAGFLGQTTIDAIAAGQLRVPKNGSVEANNAFYGPQSAYLIVTRPNVNYPATYNSDIGRPLGDSRTLSNLTGFTVVEQTHIEGAAFGTATADEVQEILRLLKSGVIL